MIKKIIAVFLLLSTTAMAGFPPTTSKGQTDTGNVTTFNFQTPNDTVYHTGVTSAITRNAKPTKNYIQYADFENGATTGWTQGTIGTLTNGLPTGTPTFGSGASGTSSITATATSGSYINGSYYLAYANSAATTQGNMIATSAITLDGQDRGAVLSVRFPYAAISGIGNFSGTSSNSYAWAAYDVTNSSWLPSSGNFCMVQSASVGTCSNAMFQTNTTTAQIRFVIYSANATSGAFTLGLDDIYVGPSVYANGPAVSDWVSYTPTFTGFGTVSGVNFQSRRVGDSLEVHGIFVSGTTTAVPAAITIGYGGSNANVVVDTSKVPATNTKIGIMGVSLAVSTAFTWSVLSPASNLSTVAMGAQTSSTSDLGPANASAIVNAGNTVSLNFMVPIVGWSSNSAQSSDSATSLIAASYYVGSAASLTSGVQINFDTKLVDTSGAVTTGVGAWEFKAPQSGFYNVSVFGINTTANTDIVLYKNGSAYQLLANFNTTTATSASSGVQLNAGDQIDLRGDTSFGTSAPSSGRINYEVTITKISSPQVITPSVSQAFDYYGSTQTVTGTASPLIEPSFLVDTVNEYNPTTGLYTAQTSGTFHCDCRVSAMYSATTRTLAQFYVGGAAYGVSGSSPLGSTTFTPVNIADDLPVLQGQTIGCYVSSVSGSSSTGTSFSSFSCHRVGF